MCPSKSRTELSGVSTPLLPPDFPGTEKFFGDWGALWRSLAYVLRMNRLTWLTAVDGSTHDKIGFHVATRMNSSTMQNFYDSEAHFKNWLCKAAREYPGGAAAFYVGFASMHEEGWFKGAPMGIGDFLMFQAAIPVSFDT